MDHELIEGLIPAYALGATDARECRAVESHLPSCDACRALLAQYRSLGDDLLYAVPAMAAPAGLTERMQRRLPAARPRAKPASWWDRLRMRPMAPALGAVILLLAITNLYWFGRMNRLERQASQQASVFDSLANAPAIPLYADAAETWAQGVVYTPPGGQMALLCVYKMAALPPGKAYQLWLIRDGQRDSGGVFQVTSDGFGLLVVRPTRPLREYRAVGITVEPGGGSPAPTSPRVLWGSL
jgi:anti-sigma-K factor RskA